MKAVKAMLLQEAVCWPDAVRGESSANGCKRNMAFRLILGF
jgi:hypothetical protein